MIEQILENIFSNQKLENFKQMNLVAENTIHGKGSELMSESFAELQNRDGINRPLKATTEEE